jgi:hypothetical protein
LQKCSQCLGDDQVNIGAAIHSPVKGYTLVFDIIYKCDGPPIQSEVNLYSFESFGEVDGSSIILINFYIPVLTRFLHCTESALQFAEHITLLGLNKRVIREEC